MMRAAGNALDGTKYRGTGVVEGGEIRLARRAAFGEDSEGVMDLPRGVTSQERPSEGDLSSVWGEAVAVLGQSVTAGGADPFATVRSDLLVTEQFLREQLADEDPLMQELGLHLLNGGGKRLRPALVLLSGQATGGHVDQLTPVAAACELIHMATLVHDDLVDESVRRRGVPTIHARWGVPVAVLFGDHLFARAFSVLAQYSTPGIVRIMSDVVARMCAGEIAELQAQWDVETTEDAYFVRVHAKTGHFIGECCRMGARAAGSSPAVEQALAAFGTHMGTCFQVVDDILDLVADEAVLGKPTGSDLRSGVYTLPVLRALAGSSGDPLRQILAHKPLDANAVRLVQELVRRSDGLDYAQEKALGLARSAQQSLATLPPNAYRNALSTLSEELVRRVV